MDGPRINVKTVAYTIKAGKQQWNVRDTARLMTVATLS